MEVSRTSILTGKTHTMDLPVTLKQLQRHANGELAQLVFPYLTPEQREFIISGITPEEWAEQFPDEDDSWDEDSWEY